MEGVISKIVWKRMGNQSRNINYTFDDIQRYLQGKMSAAEMHAVEKAALQDPFLADAIEGYSQIPASAAEQHLNEINALLFGQRKKSKLISFSPKTQWWQVAALIIVLTGVGLIGSYVFKSSNQKDEVAQVKKEENASATAPALTDSQESKLNARPGVANEEKNNTRQKEKKEVQHLSTPEKKETVNGLASADKNSETEQADARVMMAAPSMAKKNVQEDDKADLFKSAAPGIKSEKSDSLHLSLSEKNNAPFVTLSGKVLDENGEPIPDVVVQSADKKETALSNSNGYFSLRTQDSLADISTSAIGFQSKNARLKAGGENLIVLQSVNGTLNEVVVTAMGVKKSDSSNNKGAAPVGGWENFNHYVEKQLNKDTATIDNFADEDLVKLEFSIDKSGNPYNFKFLQSQDAEKNARAIEILKQGPKWTSQSKNKKVRLAIAF